MDVVASSAIGMKCPRCWRVVLEVSQSGDLSALCLRCAEVVRDLWRGDIDPSSQSPRDGQTPPFRVTMPNGQTYDWPTLGEAVAVLDRLREDFAVGNPSHCARLRGI